MAERDWVQPTAPGEVAGSAWKGKQPARFELRPLSLGEILDRIFTLYRSRFWLFAGIASVSATVHVIVQAISLATAHAMVQRGAMAPAPGLPGALANLRMVGVMSLKTYLALLIFFLISAITQAATALAVSEVYLHKPASAGEALRRVLPRWYRWIGIAAWQLGSLIWVPIAAMIPAALLLGFGARSGAVGLVAIGGILLTLAILAGFPVGFVLYLRNALATPAAVMERLTVRLAMRRSKRLAAGSKGRIFVVLLIAGALLEVVGILQLPISMLMLAAPGQQHYLARGISLLITFVGSSVVTPVALIGLTLMYFDQRVRKEALDLELLLADAKGAPAGAGGLETALDAGGYAPRV